MTRRLFFLLLLILSLLIGHPAYAQNANDQVYSQAQLKQDFDTFWQDIHDQYAYLDVTAADWDKVRQVYGAQLTGIQTRVQFSALLHEALGELSDDHAEINDGSGPSPVRWHNVPTGTDLWAEWKSDKAIITEVRSGSGAEKSGLRPGQEIVSINGVSIMTAMHERLGKCQRRSDIAAQNWALRAALAGHIKVPRTLEIRGNGKPLFRLTLDDIDGLLDQLDKEPLLEARALPQNPHIGYIWINNSLGNNALIGQFDAALARLRNTRGLIIDLRGVPSGGNTTVARAIMSRFITRDHFYQKHDIPGELRTFGVKRSWEEIVSPRGLFCYTAPVVLLVDHWTGSVGEAIAIGFDGMHRATIVGTRMAGLRGSVDDDVLPNTHITVAFQTERVFHINGTPREAFVPPMLVVPTGQADATHDMILAAGLKYLDSRLKNAQGWLRTTYPQALAPWRAPRGKGAGDFGTLPPPVSGGVARNEPRWVLNSCAREGGHWASAPLSGDFSRCLQCHL